MFGNMEFENRRTDEQNASEASIPQPIPHPRNALSNEWETACFGSISSNPFQYYSHHPWCPMVYYQSQYYPSNANIEQKPINVFNNYDSYYKTIPSMPAIASMPSMMPYFGQMYDTMSNVNMYSMTNSVPLKSTPSLVTKRVQPKAVPSNASAERKTEKKYSCKLCAGLDCNIDTNDEKLMRTHADIHLGSGPPFVCAVCGKRFPFRSTLRNHFVAHMVVRCVN